MFQGIPDIEEFSRYASDQIVNSLDDYLNIYERGPEKILLRTKKGQTDLGDACIMILREKISEFGITTPLEAINEGQNVVEREVLVYDIESLYRQFLIMKSVPGELIDAIY